MLLRNSCCLLFLVMLGFCVKGQSVGEKNFRFLNHLNEVEAFEEGVLFLNSLEVSSFSSDTLMLYSGRFEYELKNIQSSLNYFDKVSPNNVSFWNESRFYAGLQSSLLANYTASKHYFLSIDSSSVQVYQLKVLELAGVSLLLDDYAGFQKYVSMFDRENVNFQFHQDAMLTTYDRVVTRTRKSPLLAGVLSGIVPGAGKFYAGKIGSGAMALVTNTIFALQTYEGYRKDGVNSARFIIFGSLFSVFYVANIWGSVVTVRLEKTQFDQVNDETLLLHMRIPIRLLYK